MANSSTLVLIIQASQIQRAIWQQVLESQEISVMAVSPETDPTQTLIRIQQGGTPLPDVLLLDRQLPSFNPEIFCQWCRQHYPGLKIILLSRFQDVYQPERQAIIDYGAYDLLPAFQLENLAVGVIVGVKRLLAAVPSHPPLQKELLVSKLMVLKREIESGNLASLSITPGNNTPRIEVTQAQGDFQSPSLPDTGSPEPPDNSSSATKKAPKRKYRGATY